MTIPSPLPPLDEIEFVFSRSSGPGGQHTNKANTRVTLRWCALESRWQGGLPAGVLLSRLRGQLTTQGDLLISSDVHREQSANKSECLERLAEILRHATKRVKKRVKSRPSRGQREKRLDSKKIASRRKAERRLGRGW